MRSVCRRVLESVPNHLPAAEPPLYGGFTPSATVSAQTTRVNLAGGCLPLPIRILSRAFRTLIVRIIPRTLLAIAN